MKKNVILFVAFLAFLSFNSLLWAEDRPNPPTDSPSPCYQDPDTTEPCCCPPCDDQCPSSDTGTEDTSSSSCSSCSSSNAAPGSGSAGVDSVSIQINPGSPLNESSASGKLSIYTVLPTPTIFTPQGLNFTSQLGRRIYSILTTGLPSGTARVVELSGVGRGSVKYTFATGASTGYPVAGLRTYLRMVDASGNPVTSNPVYYDKINSDGGSLRFSASTMLAVSEKSKTGKVISLSDPGVNIEVIRDENWVLRQLKSAQALCDIVTIGDYKYEIRIYSPENAGSKNQQGLYEPTGSPHTVWTIENPSLDPENKIDKLKVTKSFGGTDYVFDYQYTGASNQWTLTSGGGLRSKTLFSMNSDSGTSRTDTLIISGPNGDSYTENRKYQLAPWKYQIMVEKVINPGSAALTSTWEFYTNSSQTGKYGHKKSAHNPDGSWEFYDYDTNGRKILTISSYKDAAYTTTTPSAAKATYYSYTSLDSGDTVAATDYRPRTIEEKILGTTTHKSYYVYKTVSGEYTEISERCVDVSKPYGDSSNLRTVRTYYGASAGDASIGRLKSVQNSNSSFDSYSYEYGTYSSDPNPANSAFTPGSGSAFRSAIVHGTVSSPSGIANKTTKETNIQDELGNKVLSETYVYTGSAYERISWTVTVFNNRMLPATVYRSNNTQENYTWDCCGKASETLADGTQYTYSYDLLTRPVTKTKLGSTDIVTTYTYDASNRVLSETVFAGGLSLSTASTYDLAGRITQKTDPAGLITTYSYSNGGRTVTTTHLGGFTEITDRYLDGSPKSITGTALIAKYFDKGVNTGGSQWIKQTLALSDGPNWIKTTSDPAGRTVKEEKPAFDGSTATTQHFYNSLSQLVKTTSTGKADTLFEYDSAGQLFRQGLDMNSNGTLDLASSDRITESDISYLSDSSNWYLSSVQCTYATDNSSTPTTTSITKTQLTGLPSGTIAKVINTDVFGNDTVSTTSLDRPSKTVTQTIDLPDSTANEVAVTINGLLSSSSSKSSLSYSYSYDALGRQTGTTDPRTGASVTHYNALGQIDYIEDTADNRTSFTYDSSSGRRTEVINPFSKKVIYTYNSRGQILTVRGDTDYPLDYTYDSYGRMTQLMTFRNEDLSSPDTTTWAYQDSTGLLVSKTYADAKSVTYTYSPDGKLATRTWSRPALDESGSLSTTYSYNLAGDLTSIDYSDTTPDIAFTYNRLGQQLTVTDAVGSRTFSYDSVLQPTSEAITGIYNKTIERSYDALGRSSGINIGTEYDVDYAYDTYGRFSTVTAGSDTFTYSYLANSNLISSIQYPSSISSSMSYESSRDLVTSVENKYGTTTVSLYAYENDDLGRRTDMAKSGTAFTQTDTIAYGYNDRSEVTSAVSANLATYNYGFLFDPIGNRITSASTETGSSVTRNYTANQLNQYTAIDNPTQEPTYDFDGNMASCPLSSGNWTNTWSGENQLVSQEKSDERLEFSYDYKGRRVEKKVYSGSTGNWTLTSHKRFVYNDYLQIEELDALDSNAILKKRVWSPAVYGLGSERYLSEIQSETTYYALEDANKNITEYLDASGTIQGHYEFSPFGKVTVASGANPDDFDFSFSSEYFDAETGLVYYNYRYYSPELGRWLSRDPVREEQGYNLYIMVDNNTISYLDYLGLTSCGNIMPTELEGFKNSEDVLKYLKEKYPNDPGKQKKLLVLWEKAKGLRKNRILKDVVTVIKTCGKVGGIILVYFIFIPDAGAPELPPGAVTYDPVTHEYEYHGQIPTIPKCSEDEKCKCCPCTIETKTEPCDN